MRVSLSYGKGSLPIDLPDDWEVTVIRKPAMPVLSDPDRAISTALNHPIGASPIGELARTATRACILICDITRPVPNGVILPVLIRALLAAGMQPGSIRVLVATGLHRPNLGKELRELVGSDWVLDTVEVVNHFARNDEDHVDVGTTRCGTRVRLDRRFLEADLRIATGLVEPHFMAGYSGGRKVIAPGIAHRDTITRFHSAAFMEHPRAGNSMLEGNPLHEDQLEIVRMIGGALAVNVVIDDERRISYVNFGEIIESHLAAVEFVRDYAEVAVPRRFRSIITSAAGDPLDKTYYQTVKGMVGPVDILEPGGRLLVASACSEGMGSAEYVAAQGRLVRLGPEAFLQELLDKRHADIDEWQTEMQLKPMRITNVYLYTEGLTADERALTGVTVEHSLNDAVESVLAAATDKCVAVIPEGPYVVPVFSPGGC